SECFGEIVALPAGVGGLKGQSADLVVLGERHGVFQRQVLVPHVRGGVGVLQQFPAQLGAVGSVVHQDDVFIVEQPKVLCGQARVGGYGEVEQVYLFTGLDAEGISPLALEPQVFVQGAGDGV